MVLLDFARWRELYVGIFFLYIRICNKQWKNQVLYSDTRIFGDFSQRTCIVFFMLISLKITNSSEYKIEEHNKSPPNYMLEQNLETYLS
jgi:hypothetical protein